MKAWSLDAEQGDGTAAVERRGGSRERERGDRRVKQQQLWVMGAATKRRSWWALPPAHRGSGGTWATPWTAVMGIIIANDEDNGAEISIRWDNGQDTHILLSGKTDGWALE